MKKKLISGLLCAIMAVGMLTGCGNSSTSGSSAANSGSSASGTAADDVLTLKLAHADTEESIFHSAVLDFKEEVEKRSDGKIQIQIYPAGQLGTVREYVEGIQTGTIDIAPVVSTVIANFCPDVAVYDLPFLLDDYDHAYRSLDGEVGNKLSEELTQNGIMPLAWWSIGFRNVTTSKNKPINSIADFKGFRIRTMASEIHQAIFSELGADPVPMDWGELFTALQQGTVDGQENPFSQILSSNIYEVNPVIVKTEHAFTPAVLMMSPITYGKLTEEQQKIITEAAEASKDACRQEAVTYNEEALKTLTEEKGCEYVETLDKDELREATKAVYDKFPQYSELVEQIEACKK